MLTCAMLRPLLRDGGEEEVKDEGDKQLLTSLFAAFAMLSGAAGLAGLCASGGAPALRLPLGLSDILLRSARRGAVTGVRDLY